MGKGRYTALAQPLAAPGQCFFSGEAGAEKGPYIDTGMRVTRDSPKFGRVYLSKHTVTEMYRELTTFENENPDEATASAIAEANKLAEESYADGYAAGFAACREEMKATLNAVVNALGNSASGSSVDDLTDLLADRPVDDEEADGIPPVPDEGAKGSKSGATKVAVGPDADSGSEEPGRVSGDSGNDGGILI